MMFNFKACLLPFIVTLFALSGCSDHDDSGPTTDPYKVVEIQLSATDTTMPIGLSQTINAVVVYYNGEMEEIAASELVWSSNNITIASVDTLGVVTGVGVDLDSEDQSGTTSINALYSGQDGQVSSAITVTVTEAVLTSIEIVPGNQQLPLGLNEEYSAKAIYSDSAEYEISKDANLVWSSSNTDAVYIDPTTAITNTIEEGLTTITASYQSIENSVQLLVVDEALVNIFVEVDRQAGTPLGEETTVVDGFSIQFSATAIYTNSTEDITEHAIWSSSEEQYLTLSETTKGEFIGAGEGDANVSATLGEEVSNEVTVNVTHGELIGIEITSEIEQLPLGLTYQLTAMATFTGDNVVNVTSESDYVIWSSNKYATVNQTGEVEGVEEGLAQITIGDLGGKASNTINILINEATLTDEVKITTEASDYIATGEAIQYIATGTFTDGSEHVLTKDNISWKLVQNESTGDYYQGDASIDSDGNVLNDALNTRETAEGAWVTAIIDGFSGGDNVNKSYYSDNLAIFAATKILSINKEAGSSLSFVAPLSEVDAQELEITYNESVPFEENGVTGPDGESFMTVNYALAQIQCEELVYNKFDDYRLPTYDELLSVWTSFDDESDDVYKLYTEQKWSVGSSFWTSTIVDEATESADASYKLVDLKEGSTLSAASASNYHYVTCVREQ